MSIVLEGIVQEKSGSMFIDKKKNDESCNECLQCRACCHVFVTFKDQKPTIVLFRGDGT